MDILHWIFLIVILLGVLIAIPVLVTFGRAISRLNRNDEDIELQLIKLNQTKVDKPKPPPNIVPLETM